MNRSKKNLRPVLWLTAIAFVILMGGMAYAADQTVVLNPSTATLSQSDNLDITVNYNCGEKVDTFSVVICYDSTKLTLLDPPVTNLFGDAGLIEAYDDTADNNDGDAATDKYISLLYMGTFNPATFEFAKDWPQTDVPLDVITVHFQVNATVADGTTTKINVVDKAEIGNFSGTGSEITVGVGGATPQTITEADGTLWATPGLVIVDVADTDGRITGAMPLADVATTISDKDTPILVYSSDPAIDAKAEADKLMADPNNFTKVYYLDDTFANWANTVNATKVEYKLTIVIAAGTGGTGTVTANGTQVTDSTWFTKDTVVTLVATPEAGSKFDAFSGDTPTDTVTMDSSKNVTATFSPDTTCALTEVTITAAPTSGTAPLTVTLTAVANATADGYEWTVKDASGNDIAAPQTTATNTFTVTDLPAGNYTAYVTASDSATGCSVAQTAPANIEATVIPVNYALTLNVNPAAGGTATAAVAGPYAAGTVVNITATPAAGYKFVSWTGNVVSNPSMADTTITMDGNKDVTANFELIPADEYTLTVNATAGGTAAATTAGPYAAGTVVNITATPAAGYKFVNWTGDAVANATAAATTITMDADKTVTANFEIVGACSATISGPTSANLNEAVTFTATVDTLGATVTNYHWTMGDGNAFDTAVPSITHTYTSGGSASIHLAITTDQGANCNPEAHWSITLNDGTTPNGDGDCNGYVDIYDALLAAIIDAGNPDNISICDEDMLDVDENGVIDINDALAIALYDVGMTCTCVLDPEL